MLSLNLDASSARLILFCLEEKSYVVLRRIDNLRKMKDSIDDELYHSISNRYQEELELVQNAIVLIES